MLKLTPELESAIHKAALILTGSAAKSDVCKEVGNILLDATMSSFPTRDFDFFAAGDLATALRTARMTSDPKQFLSELENMASSIGFCGLFGYDGIAMSGRDWRYIFRTGYIAFGLDFIPPEPPAIRELFFSGNTWESRHFASYIKKDMGLLVATGEAVNIFFHSQGKSRKARDYLFFLLQLCMDYYRAEAVMFCLSAHLISIIKTGTSLSIMEPLVGDVLERFSLITFAESDKENILPGFMMELVMDTELKRSLFEKDSEREPLQDITHQHVTKAPRLIGCFEDDGFHFVA
eukprot:jgi/Mesvir1/19796/Mv13088-RA.1